MKSKKIFGIVVSLVMILTLFTPTFANAESKPEMKITVNKTDVSEGDEIEASVLLNTNSSNDVFSVDSKITFDGNVLEIVGDPVVVLDTEITDCNNNAENNYSYYTWTTLKDDPLVYNGVLCKVNFKVKNGAPLGESSIQFDTNATTLGNDSGEIAIDTSYTNATINVTKALKGISFEGDKTSANLNVGQTDSLTVVYDPADTTDDKTVTWTTSKESVVTVSNGTVTAVGPGTATVTAKVGDKTATCEYTVKAPLTSIELNNGENDVSLVKGQNKNISIKYNPENTTDSKAVTWASSDETVATVDGNGKVKAIKAGTTTITATSTVSDRITDTVTLTVTEIPLNSITFEQADDTMLRWDDMQLTVIYSPEDTTDDKVVTWESSDENIATVDENGLVTALKEGTVTITAKVPNSTILPAEKQITVEEKHLEDFDISNNKTELTVGDECEIDLTLNPEDCTDIIDYYWDSSDEDVVSTNEDGIYTARKAGKATITVKLVTEYDEEFIKEFEVEVKEKEVEATTEEDSTPKAEETKTSSPQTGDLPIVGIVATALISLGGAVVVAKKKLLN